MTCRSKKNIIACLPILYNKLCLGIHEAIYIYYTAMIYIPYILYTKRNSITLNMLYSSCRSV